MKKNGTIIPLYKLIGGYRDKVRAYASGTPSSTGCTNNGRVDPLPRIQRVYPAKRGRLSQDFERNNRNEKGSEPLRSIWDELGASFLRRLRCIKLLTCTLFELPIEQGRESHFECRHHYYRRQDRSRRDIRAPIHRFACSVLT